MLTNYYASNPSLQKAAAMQAFYEFSTFHASYIRTKKFCVCVSWEFYSLGVFSVIWYFLGMSLIFLQWIDQWGETTAWLIRGAFIVIDAILYFVGKPSYKEE